MCVWDFSCPKDKNNKDDIKSLLKEYCKKWCFQEELGESESGYEHFQGRLNLKVKSRLSGLKKKFPSNWHFTITSNENKDNMFYVQKEETRVDGPWSDEDEDREVYIPRQYRDKIDNLRPFQQYIWDSADEFDDRSINCIICKKGNVGKSMIASLCDLYERGFDIPPINDSEKLIQSVCNMLAGRKSRNPKLIFLDIPRSVKQDKLSGMFTAIEQIKKGKVYDMRYKFKDWWYDSPQIWVFMNVKPKTKYLSRDRWRFWAVNEEFELVPYKPNGKIKKINFNNEEGDLGELKNLYDSDDSLELDSESE